MTENRVKLVIQNGIADVQMARPEKMNALDLDMFNALAETGLRLKSETGLRAVVLSGEGKSFCSGLDIMAIQASGGASLLTERKFGDANLAQVVATIWRDIPVPVIAALHGVVYGGGFQICLGADIRYVTPQARLSVMEIKWGLVPDMAGNIFMNELSRPDLVRELTFTGRIFSGVEAVSYGFATRACDEPYEEARKTAQEIAQKNPDAIRAAKRLANLSGKFSRSELLIAETNEQMGIIGSPNQIEAAMANFEKREPVFSSNS